MGSAKRYRGLIRQWRLVRALQKARMGMTFKQLVEAADEPVCLRTIRRDVDTLTFAGFPIDVESGQPGTRSEARIYLREWTVN